MAVDKKRRGRRAYLEDFQKTATGEYVYTGKLHYYETQGLERRQALLRLWLLTGAIAAAVVVSGCVPAAGMSNTFYVLLPYAGALLSAASVVWLMCRLAAGGDPLRHYVYTATVAQMRVRGRLVLIFSALTLVGEVVHLILDGVGTLLPGTLVFLACQLICLAAALAWESFVKKLNWSN